MSLWTRGSGRAFSTRGLCGMSQICIATFWKIAYLIAMQCKGEPDMSYPSANVPVQRWNRAVPAATAG